LSDSPTHHKFTGGYRSQWGAELFANVRSVVGIVARWDLTHITPLVTYCAALPRYSRAKQLPVPISLIVTSLL
jgi:hypothetical protein